MKIELTSRARWQYSLLTGIESPTSGFVLGYHLGRIQVVDGFFPLKFNKNNINRLYHRVFMASGEQLLGVFFVNSRVFLNDWFLENIIIEISSRRGRVFVYRLDPGDGQKRCESVCQI